MDMSLSENGIAGMLDDYEQDYKTGMNVKELASLVYEYTSGYPFLVSRICKLIDEKTAGSPEFPDKKRHGPEMDFWRQSGCFFRRKIPCLSPNGRYVWICHIEKWNGRCFEPYF